MVHACFTLEPAGRITLHVMPAFYVYELTIGLSNFHVLPTPLDHLVQFNCIRKKHTPVIEAILDTFPRVSSSTIRYKRDFQPMSVVTVVS